jgi:phosphatidyl-myo-inositol dimannoside synthase
MKILFLYLSAFGITGGIEKFNKAFMKALSEISDEQKTELSVISSHDSRIDERYIDEKRFTGFGGRKLWFVPYAFLQALKHDIIFLGHINLAPVGLLIKTFKPKIKIYLAAHGIEIWNEVSFIKRLFLKKCDFILAVSNYTKERIIETHKFPAERITIFPNTIDPYFNIHSSFEKPAYLMERYGLPAGSKIILTVTRISLTEGYKGYDKVMEVLPEVLKVYPGTKYILAGKYGSAEKKMLDGLIKQYKIQANIILAGFIKEEELTDHYQLADVFIMPSKKEGFGIVFLEALASGLPVIAGSKDGSADALMNGELGTLVDPDNNEEIYNALVNHLQSSNPKNTSKVLKYFSYENFKGRLKEIRRNCSTD